VSPARAEQHVQYSHTQSGWWLYIALGFGAAGLFAAIAIVTGGRIPREGPPVIFILGVTLAILLLTAAFFSTLTVEVSATTLLWRFGPGLIRFSLPLGEITAVAPARTPLWAGIGIHWIFTGWVYNVSGRDAVEITKRDGSKVWIGTDEPLLLATAIERARATAAVSRDTSAAPRPR
jgi:hypothetical protein